MTPRARNICSPSGPSIETHHSDDVSSHASERTSVAETFGMSTVEAMGAGLPIMGIHSTGISDIVEDGKTGLLSTEDLAAFTAKLTYLCLHPNLRREMGLAACEASKQYDIERTTDILLKHYIRVTQNTRPLKRSLDERLMSVLEEFMR